MRKIILVEEFYQQLRAEHERRERGCEDGARAQEADGGGQGR